MCQEVHHIYIRRGDNIFIYSSPGAIPLSKEAAATTLVPPSRRLVFGFVTKVGAGV